MNAPDTIKTSFAECFETVKQIADLTLGGSAAAGAFVLGEVALRNGHLGFGEDARGISMVVSQFGLLRMIDFTAW
jgi:hypothetical protein